MGVTLACCRQCLLALAQPPLSIVLIRQRLHAAALDECARALSLAVTNMRRTLFLGLAGDFQPIWAWGVELTVVCPCLAASLPLISIPYACCGVVRSSAQAVQHVLRVLGASLVVPVWVAAAS